MGPEKLIVTGCARSGTTLLHALLGLYPDIKIYRYAETHPAKLDEHWARGRFLHSPKRFVAIKRPQLRPGDPRRFRLAELLAGGYRILNLVRDGRDVLVSRHPDDPDRYWVEPERWTAAVSETLELASHPRLHIIRYESLAREPIPTLNDIARVLDIRPPRLDDSAATLLPEDSQAREYLARAVMGGARAVDASRVGTHRRPAHADRLRAILADGGDSLARLLSELGYPESEF